MTVQSEVGHTSQESDSPAGAVASSELAVRVGVGPGVDVGAVDRAQGALSVDANANVETTESLVSPPDVVQRWPTRERQTPDWFVP